MCVLHTVAVFTVLNDHSLPQLRHSCQSTVTSLTTASDPAPNPWEEKSLCLPCSKCSNLPATLTQEQCVSPPQTLHSYLPPIITPTLPLYPLNLLTGPHLSGSSSTTALVGYAAEKAGSVKRKHVAIESIPGVLDSGWQQEVHGFGGSSGRWALRFLLRMHVLVGMPACVIAVVASRVGEHLHCNRAGVADWWYQRVGSKQSRDDCCTQHVTHLFAQGGLLSSSPLSTSVFTISLGFLPR